MFKSTEATVLKWTMLTLKRLAILETSNYIYGHLCISAEDRLHVLCVLCVHLHMSVCVYHTANQG